MTGNPPSLGPEFPASPLPRPPKPEFLIFPFCRYPSNDYETVFSYDYEARGISLPLESRA